LGQLRPPWLGNDDFMKIAAPGIGYAVDRVPVGLNETGLNVSPMYKSVASDIESECTSSGGSVRNRILARPPGAD